jgi:N-acylglucosamine 2-epimerase
MTLTEFSRQQSDARSYLRDAAERHRGMLLGDIVPFWLRHSIDRACGGYLTCLDREGAVYATDKQLWLQAREVWMFSTLCTMLQERDDWRDAARTGYEFLRRHGFDADGRMFFLVARDGRPLRRRRYVFSEAFAVMAFAAYHLMTGDEEPLELAQRTYATMISALRTPGRLEPKLIEDTRRLQSLALPMMLVASTQELSLTGMEPLYREVVDEAIHRIREHFFRKDHEALVEQVGPTGEIEDIPACRCLNPGHAIETAWFLLREARMRGDAGLRRFALRVLERSMELGWDSEHGGLFAFVDLDGRPPEQLEWDMKLWWPHTEALYALLLAYATTGERSHRLAFDRVEEYTLTHFPDPQHGEWYGYLHRDGTLASPLKGSLWKGMFHIPRALLYCSLLEHGA